MKIGLIVAGIVLLMILTVSIISVIENQKLKVTQYHIRSPKIPKAFHGCRFVVLADLHNACFEKDNRLLLEKIRKQQPDYIFIAGDMLVGKPKKSTEVPARLIEELAKEYPVFYGKGNHEQRISVYPETYGEMWKEYRERLGENVIWLENARVPLRKNGAAIYLYGLDLEPRFYKRLRKQPMEKEYLTQVLGTPEPETYTILLAHNPDYFSEYARWGADLVLAGHLHGGMIRLPLFGGVLSPMFHIFPKYDRGRYEEGNSTMLLSGGLGNHTVPIRVNNLPELLTVILESGETSANEGK